MLQDVETGRPLELDALVGSVLELGRITGVPTPNLTAVHACVALLAKTLGEAKGRRLPQETAGWLLAWQRSGPCARPCSSS